MLKSLLNILLVILLFISTIGFVGYQLTKPDFLISQAENVHLYQQATGQLTAFLPKDALKDLPFNATEIQTILGSAIDANTFYSTLGQATTAYLNYLTGRTTTLNFHLNLAPLKRQVADQATAALITKYQGLPTCKPAELKGWDASSGFPSCQLPASNVAANDVDTLLAGQVDQALASVPATVVAPTPSPELVNARARTIQVLQLIRVAWLATAAVVLLYVIVARRRAFGPLAMIFLLAGLIEVAFSLVAWDWVKGLIVDLVNHPGQSQQLVAMTSTVADDVVQTLKTITGTLSIITLSISGLFIILWGFSRFARPKGQMEVPKP